MLGEIKQNNPRSSDGTYWLQTATMDAPGQFFCDQTTDGGGWVMIGRGREGWETWSQGRETRLASRPARALPATSRSSRRPTRL